MGYEHVSAIDMLTHLEKRGGTMDFMDTHVIKQKHDTPWDVTTHLTSYFTRVERARQQLERAGIESNPNELRNQALYMFHQSGKLERSLIAWENLPTERQTWPHLNPLDPELS